MISLCSMVYKLNNFFMRATASASPVFLSRSSEILTHGLPSIEDSLMTILSALLFSVPPEEAFLKSFVSEVPIPKDAVYVYHYYAMIYTQAREIHAFKTLLITLALEVQHLVDGQCIGVYNHL
jgi:hypothetical protein